MELDYVLALALERFHLDSTQLVEPEWVAKTPYERERRGRRRYLKNPIVLREVVTRFAGLPFKNYFFLGLTTDPSNPFRVASNTQLFPEIFHPDFGPEDCWPKMAHKFGWLNYAALETVIRKLQERQILRSDSLFLESLAMNRDNMEFQVPSSEATIAPGEEGASSLEHQTSKRRGTSMIYAPAINARSFVHFSWRGESCALRDYSKGSSVQPPSNRGYPTSTVRSLIKQEHGISKKEPPVADSAYWYAKTIRLNAHFLH